MKKQVKPRQGGSRTVVPKKAIKEKPKKTLSKPKTKKDLNDGSR